MSNTMIERPQANDPVQWDTLFGPVTGHLVRYLDDTTALCELRRGGILKVNLATSNLRVDPHAFRPGNFQ